jgi:hypothetical protein
MLIAQRAVDFIVRQEVTSPAYYERHYRKPEWPGGASGITIACGYDLGYATATKVQNDWAHLVSADMLAVMMSCCGVKGNAARALLPKVKDKIDIPWSAALEVFQNRDIPQWTAVVQKTVPNTTKVSALCLGMLVATAYNRGAAGFTAGGDRYRELRAIRADMAASSFTHVASEFRSMTRLWPNMRGLRDRYTETAKLWEEGLKDPPIEVAAPDHPLPGYDPEIPTNAGPARTKPSATTPAQNGATGAVVVATGQAAQHAAQSGLPMPTVVAIAAFGLLVAATIWVTWYRNRNPK